MIAKSLLRVCLSFIVDFDWPYTDQYSQTRYYSSLENYYLQYSYCQFFSYHRWELYHGQHLQLGDLSIFWIILKLYSANFHKDSFLKELENYSHRCWFYFRNPLGCELGNLRIFSFQKSFCVFRMRSVIAFVGSCFDLITKFPKLRGTAIINYFHRLGFNFLNWDYNYLYCSRHYLNCYFLGDFGLEFRRYFL